MPEVVTSNRPTLEFIEQNGLQDYEQATPGFWASLIDKGVASRATCPACGRIGLDFWPFKKPGSYRPFAACPDCGNAWEF